MQSIYEGAGIMNALKKKELKTFLLTALIATAAVWGITLLTYATFFHEFLEQFAELSDDVIALISRDNVNIFTMVLANIAHGFLLTTMIRWSKFRTPLGGAKVGAAIAFLTEIYFCFSQYSMFKTMSMPSAIIDTIMWTLINSLVGALVAWIFGKAAEKQEKSKEAHK